MSIKKLQEELKTRKDWKSVEEVEDFFDESLKKAYELGREEVIRDILEELPKYEDKENDVQKDGGELNNYIRGSWMGFNTCLDEVKKKLNKLKK